MRGQNIVISNDKKELLNILTGLYKKKEIAARKAIDEYKAGVFNYYSNSELIRQRLMAQPKHVMESYKNFVKKLKKISHYIGDIGKIKRVTKIFYLLTQLVR